jgi:hypothetical protein
VRISKTTADGFMTLKKWDLNLAMTSKNAGNFGQKLGCQHRVELLHSTKKK